MLNYTGYSHRKAGRLDVGITFYRKALTIDPNFVLARRCLGEGYVAAGRVDLMVELKEIGTRCGWPARNTGSRRRRATAN
ncbi:MAG: hypothetical protein U1F47_03145 [Hyphomicrobiales bacterium]